MTYSDVQLHIAKTIVSGILYYSKSLNERMGCIWSQHYIKTHDRNNLRCEDLILLPVQRVQSTDTGEAPPITAGVCEEDSSRLKTQGRPEAGPGYKPQVPLQFAYTHQIAHSSKSFHGIQDSAISWAPRVQTYEPVGAFYMDSNNE